MPTRVFAWVAYPSTEPRETPADNMSTAAAQRLQEEISGMGKGDLRKKALALGADQTEVDDCAEQDDEKAALIELILANDPVTKLAKMKVGALRTHAKQVGVSQDDIDAASDKDDEKAALIALIQDPPKRKTPIQEPKPRGPVPEPEPMLEPVPTSTRPHVTVTAAYQLSAGGLSRQKSIHMRDERGSPSVRKIEMGGAQLKLLKLVNEVQEISLGDLNISDQGSALEWPQICVVGGQAEGKSTLLSAIVSANMTAKMNFLPEGSDMVTRCPILVQMTCPKDEMQHSAIISTQRSAGEHGESGVPGQGGLIPGPGAVPTATEIESWGLHIQHSITALQDSIVAKNQVTHQKIIVRLKGPCLPNLTLVDLPGLRAVDDAKTVGLKDRLLAMVTANLLSPSAIILCVGAAGTDPTTWVGRGLAKQVDQQETRTIGVVTKADTLFGYPPTELQKQNQEQLKRVLLEEEDTPYYAAYNPRPQDEQAFRDHGINLQQEMEAMFRPGHVGNEAIAKDLEGKLADHLEEQLPALYKRFRIELDRLNAELKSTSEPSWTVVEQLMLTYSRHVSHYVLKSSNPKDVLNKTGISEKTNDAVQAGTWDHKQSIKTALAAIVKSFTAKVEPQAVYNDPAAYESVLYMHTTELLEKVEELAQPTLEERGLLGGLADKQKIRKDDSIVAVELGIELSKDLSSLCGDVLGDIGVELESLLKRYYRAVATVKFTLADIATLAESGQNDRTYQVRNFPVLYDKLMESTDALLHANWAAVLRKAAAKDETPDAAMVGDAFLSLDEVEAALSRVCDLHKSGMPRLVTDLVEASMPAQRLPSTVPPPEGQCYKKRPKFGTWPERYIKVKNNGRGGFGLFVYNDKKDAMSRESVPRGSSIADLTGCVVTKKYPEHFTFAGDCYRLDITHETPGYLKETDNFFAFQDQDKRDAFAAAIENIAAGRSWDKTAEMQRAEDEAARVQAEEERQAEIDLRALQKVREAEEKQALDDMQPEPEPEPERAVFNRVRPTTGEIKALKNGPGNPQQLAFLPNIWSQPFHTFYTTLKNTNGGGASQDEIQREVKAESFRLFSLSFVRTQTQNTINSVSLPCWTAPCQEPF